MLAKFLRKTPALRWTFLLLVVVPAASWALVRPLRVVAPGLAGVSCVKTEICVDDESKRDEASALYSEATGFIGHRFGLTLRRPRVVFCSAEACAKSFGLGERSAVTVGTIGTVIGPKAWKPFYVRHELIHQLQGEQLGVVSTLLKPSWLVEGMAYAMSEDPREVLGEPWQGYRTQFRAWYDQVGKDRLWPDAAKL